MRTLMFLKIPSSWYFLLKMLAYLSKTSNRPKMKLILFVLFLGFYSPYPQRFNNYQTLKSLDNEIFAKGIVVYNKSKCDYYIVETSMGFALLEWYGGNDPNEGDIIVGDFESYGFKDIFNVTKDAEMRVWVEDYWLNKERVSETYIEKCD